MISIMVTGCNGQLGTEIIKGIEDKTIITALPWKADIRLVKASSKELDITDRDSVSSCVAEVKPDVIINCAAYTDVDEAEEDYGRAFQVNALGAGNLAIAAESVGAKVIHISTDYVFDGRGVISDGKITPYREYDLPNPINVYGKTKLLGENYVREFCSRYFIVRTSWLYGESGNNFVKTIIKIAKEKGKLTGSCGL